jgi:hypothetical protein
MDVKPCSPLKLNRLFGEICRLHLQGRIIRQAGIQGEGGSNQSCFLPARTLESQILERISFFSFCLKINIIILNMMVIQSFYFVFTRRHVL